MPAKAATPDAYYDALPANRKDVMLALRDAIAGNIPKGFEETVQYGIPGWSVPHSIYPSGYHADPSQQLPFIGIASHKQHIAVYHMGVACDDGLRTWLEAEYAKLGNGKLDIGKSCIRFRKPEQVPITLIGRLARKLTPAKWIAIYEASLKRSRSERRREASAPVR